MSISLQTPDLQELLTTERPPPAPISSSSPSSARIGTSTKDKRLKLRASCDACAASKIRCSKDHPTCARCSNNKSQCVYGVSRKHGKPGRKRRRNPDGTSFIKVVKCQPSSTTSQARKTGLPNRPQTAQLGLKMASGWVSEWPPTLGPPDTPACDFEAISRSIYTNGDYSNANCADRGFLPLMRPEPEPYYAVDSQFYSHDPFMASQVIQLGSSHLQAPEDYLGSDLATPENCPSIDITTIPCPSFSSYSQSALYDPTSRDFRHGRPAMASSLSIPPQSSNYGYALTTSAFDSAVSWGGSLLSSPVSDSVCSSSSSISGIVSPFMVLDVQHDVAPNISMQPWHFSGCELDGGSVDNGRA